jgi:transposase
VPTAASTTDDQEDLTEMVMIGIDPHKGSHTAVALDDHELELGALRIRAGKRQREQLLEWAAPFDARVWAIESANGLGYLLAQQLLAAGERVLDVPATLASRVRVLSSGRSNKNDPNDARSVAIAALRSPAMTEVRAEDHVTVLRLLAKRHIDLGRWRNKVCCRLHAHVCELVAGGISKEIVVAQASELLGNIRPRGVAAVERHRQSLELVEDLVRIDEQLHESLRRIKAAVTASGSSLPELFGVGPVNAAILIGYTGDPLRFATHHRYAAYNGTAPIEIASAGRTVHRLSLRGNRQLNHALHMAAVTQVRHSHSPGRAYFDRKVKEDKTPKEALRALKRRISDAVYRRLVADARRARA